MLKVVQTIPGMKNEKVHYLRLKGVQVRIYNATQNIAKDNNFRCPHQTSTSKAPPGGRDTNLCPIKWKAGIKHICSTTLILPLSGQNIS